MLIFLTWSGERSRQVALALREALPMICNPFTPWMSEEDIAKGTRWAEEIAAALDKAQAAILCLTPENQDERWVLFEAGALSRTRTKCSVTPYLLDLAPRELKPPLSAFQGVTSALDLEENLRMVRALFGALPEAERDIDDKTLENAFRLVWREVLERRLGAVGLGPVAPLARRPDSEVRRDPQPRPRPYPGRQMEFHRRGREGSDEVPTATRCQAARRSTRTSAPPTWAGASPR